MVVRMSGMGSGLIDPTLVDKLIEAQKIPVETAKKRKELIVDEKKEVQKFDGLLQQLNTTINSLKTKPDFYKLKVESSNPDIIDGTVESYALPGSYEFEVRGVAKTEKELAYGFPDKDKTPVGFGYMGIEVENGKDIDLEIEPYSTLQDIANKINDQDAGVKAMIINTKYKPNPYRLLVVSEKSGKEAKISVDEDTTFLEFKEQVTGKNLDVLFEDVPITDEDNTMESLIDGVVLVAKRAEPGTRVQVNITYDIDATLKEIKAFVDKYNEIADFVHTQFQIDPKTKKAGILAADGTLRTVMRSLQSSFTFPINNQGKYSTLASIGITTDPKTGKLIMKEPKVKQALAENYDDVAAIFIRGKHGRGIADRMAASLKNFRDPSFGAVKSRIRGLDRIIKNADQDIERRERLLTQKEQNIRKKFSNLESKLMGLKSQSSFMAQRLGGTPIGGGSGGNTGQQGK